MYTQKGRNIITGQPSELKLPGVCQEIIRKKGHVEGGRVGRPC